MNSESINTVKIIHEPFSSATSINSSYLKSRSSTNTYVLKRREQSMTTYNSPLNPHASTYKSRFNKMNKLGEKEYEDLAFMNKLSRNDSFSQSNIRDSENLTFRAIANSVNKKGFEVPPPTIAVDKWIEEDSDSFFSTVEFYSK